MLEEELGRMAPDLGVIEEWQRKDADYQQRLRDLEAATAARNQVLHCPSASHSSTCTDIATSRHEGALPHRIIPVVFRRPAWPETKVSTLHLGDDLMMKREQVREVHETLRKQRLDEFMAGFNAISLKLKEMYQMITLGGDAELELVDSLDPFSEVRAHNSAMSRYQFNT